MALSSGFAGMSKSTVPAHHFRQEPPQAHPLRVGALYGFSREAYDVVYPAGGDPVFAEKVKKQLESHNIKAKLVDRGVDHGVYVPMVLIRPEADIPIVTMTINSRLSNQAHFDLGKAIAPFRDEGTLIVWSGQATHNMHASREPRNPLMDWAAAFQECLDNTFMSESKLSYSQRGGQVIHTIVKCFVLYGPKMIALTCLVRYPPRYYMYLPLLT